MRALTLLLTLTLYGCSVGPKPQDYAPASVGYGAGGTLRTPAATYEGELIGTRDDGFVLLTRRGLFHVPFSAIRRVNFSKIANMSFFRDGITTDFIEKLRLVSRFPQGVDDDLLARLLTEYKQTTLQSADV